MSEALQLSNIAARLPRGTRRGIDELRAMRQSMLDAVIAAIGGDTARLVAPGLRRVESLRHQVVFMDLMILMIPAAVLVCVSMFAALSHFLPGNALGVDMGMVLGINGIMLGLLLALFLLARLMVHGDAWRSLKRMSREVIGIGDHVLMVGDHHGEVRRFPAAIIGSASFESGREAGSGSLRISGLQGEEIVVMPDIELDEARDIAQLIGLWVSERVGEQP